MELHLQINNLTPFSGEGWLISDRSPYLFPFYKIYPFKINHNLCMNEIEWTESMFYYLWISERRIFACTCEIGEDEKRFTIIWVLLNRSMHLKVVSSMMHMPSEFISRTAPSFPIFLNRYFALFRRFAFLFAFLQNHLPLSLTN